MALRCVCSLCLFETVIAEHSHGCVFFYWGPVAQHIILVWVVCLALRINTNVSRFARHVEAIKPGGDAESPNGPLQCDVIPLDGANIPVPTAFNCIETAIGQS